MSSQLISSRLSKRQVVLFFVAIVLPCSLLVALSLLIMSQQNELVEKRHAEEQRRMVDEVRHELSARLEKIKLQQVTTVATQGNKNLPTRFADRAIALLGWVEGNHLLLPWDLSPSAERSRKLLQETKYSEAIQKGEHGEARPLTSHPAVVRSCALLVPLWVEQLPCRLPALKLLEAALQQLFQHHPDHEVFDSFPGAGRGHREWPGSRPW